MQQHCRVSKASVPFLLKIRPWSIFRTTNERSLKHYFFPAVFDDSTITPLETAITVTTNKRGRHKRRSLCEIFLASFIFFFLSFSLSLSLSLSLSVSFRSAQNKFLFN